MNRVCAVIYAVAVALVVLLFARETYEPIEYLYEEHTGFVTPMSVSGWLIAILGPLFLSICVWLSIHRLHHRWLAHLIFLPVAMVMVREGGNLFFYGASVSGDNSPEGYALMIAIGFLLLTLLVHSAALIVEMYKVVRRQAKGS